MDGNGWFEFVPLPPGRYRFVVYRRPSPLDGAFELGDAGEMVGGALVNCDRPHHDLELNWFGGD